MSTSHIKTHDVYIRTVQHSYTEKNDCSHQISFDSQRYLGFTLFVLSQQLSDTILPCLHSNNKYHADDF
jgi:hypothetical protein